MIGLPQDGTHYRHDLPEQGALERFDGGDVWEICVDVSDDSHVSLFEEGKVLFLVPGGVFLHGEVGTIVLFGLFKVIPIFEVKPVVLIICQ